MSYGSELVLLMMGFLILKHLVLDFLYQPPYQYLNKGTFGHPGGIIHSGQHVIGTLFGGVLFAELVQGWSHRLVELLWWSAAIEFIIHYLMDWFKMWFNRRQNWTPINGESFWKLLGVDQFVHMMTYVGLIYLWATVLHL